MGCIINRHGLSFIMNDTYPAPLPHHTCTSPHNTPPTHPPSHTHIPYTPHARLYVISGVPFVKQWVLVNVYWATWIDLLHLNSHQDVSCHTSRCVCACVLSVFVCCLCLWAVYVLGCLCFRVVFMCICHMHMMHTRIHTCVSPTHNPLVHPPSPLLRARWSSATSPSTTPLAPKSQH